MPFETTREVLEHAREFHRDLKEYYKSLMEKTDQERVRMLLDYLSRHEKNLEEGLARYESEIASKIRDTWFQYPPPKEAVAVCKDIAISNIEDLSVDGIVKLALDFDSCIIEMYEAIIKSSDSAEVREIFQSLLNLEKQEELELVRDSLELKDL